VKISCPSCSAKYSISDEKVVSRLAKIRCRKCGATIVIDGKVNPPHVTASASGDGATEEHAVQEHTDTGTAGLEYSVDLGEGDQRTMPLADILAAYNSGQITGETFVWADGFADWKPLSEVEEIVNALHAAASGGQPASSPGASPWDAKPQAQPSPARAAARSARAAGGSDLFGRIDRAGSEEDVATSAPEPAGFGGGGGGGAATGARNESSVLFSLSALTSASAPVRTPSASSPSRSSAGSATRDDSGLIDLKALTAAAVKTESAGAAPLAAPAMMAPLAPSPLGVAAPLGLGSPLGGGLGGVDLGAPQKSKTGLFIAIGIVAAALIVALALILRPAPPPPIVQAPPPPPTPAAAPTPTPTPTLTAAPPPTGSAEEEAAPAKKPTSSGIRRVSGTTKKPSSGTTSGGGSEPAAAPAPKPKSSKCGCAPGDLRCAMQCAAKGG
jgi:predicted Zn finger-like uncharacterized protein